MRRKGWRPGRRANAHFRPTVRACPACGGDGHFLIAGQMVTCRKCRGSGRYRNV
jgi:DnaJ-class molecular chaperone